VIREMKMLIKGKYGSKKVCFYREIVSGVSTSGFLSEESSEQCLLGTHWK